MKECCVCHLEAPTFEIESDNMIVSAITFGVIMDALGWHASGDWLYCPEHIPQRHIPDDMLERLAVARGEMLAKARKR